MSRVKAAVGAGQPPGGPARCVVVEAAHAQPQLRRLYPFPSHGTLHFHRAASPWQESDHDVPFIVCGGPPYTVYVSGYSTLLGEAATPEEAAALVVAHLPRDITLARE